MHTKNKTINLPNFERRNPLTAQTRLYLVLFVGGKRFPFAPPLPYLFWSSEHSVHLLLQYRWAAVYPNSFYLVNGLPVKKTAVAQTALLPGNLWYWSITFSTRAPCLFQYSPKYMYEFYSTLTHRAGRRSIFFHSDPVCSEWLFKLSSAHCVA